jgi:uncharacterized membrane protein
MYDLFKFMHVLTAIVWIGSGIGLMVMWGILEGAGERGTLLGVLRFSDKLGTRLFAPAAVLTLVFGIVTVVLSRKNIAFEDLWIVIGFAGFAASFVISQLSGRAGKQMGALIAEHGPQHGGVDAVMSRIRMLNTVDILILVGVVAAMVFKPGT